MLRAAGEKQGGDYRKIQERKKNDIRVKDESLYGLPLPSFNPKKWSIVILP